MHLASKDDIIRILEVLNFNYEKNLYIYIDIQEYGIENNFIKTWIEEENNVIKQIILKYYNSFQIFITDRNNIEYKNITRLISEYTPRMISGEKIHIKNLYNDEIIKNKYESAYGYILKQNISDFIKEKIDIPELAEKEDMKEISKLICSDREIGGHYNVSDLENQLLNRFNNNIGRNIIIRKNNNIVAHYATYAESNRIAVMGGLIVHPYYRGRGYAKKLHTYLSNVLIREGKEVYLFCQENVLNMYLKLGSEICGYYGKLTLKEG